MHEVLSLENFLLNHYNVTPFWHFASVASIRHLCIVYIVSAAAACSEVQS